MPEFIPDGLSVPRLSDEDAAKCKKALEEHPEWTGVYLFFDGSIEGPNAGLTLEGSRTEQLVQVSTRGFPVHIGRAHDQIKLQPMSDAIKKMLERRNSKT